MGLLGQLRVHLHGPSRSRWGVVGENTAWSASSNTNAPITLESPHVAWRNDFINSSQFGYIVWGKKVFSETLNSITGDSDYQVTTGTQIGIRVL